MKYREKISLLEKELNMLKRRVEYGTVYHVRSDKWTHERTFDNLEGAMRHYNFIRTQTPNKAVIKKTELFYDKEGWETLAIEE